MKKTFALTGAAGYIAPRHLKAIHETGNELIAVLDPFDSVGILDSFFEDVSYFKEFERFDRHIEKLKLEGKHLDFLSICSPNHLHDSHIRFALRIGADTICEKPLVLNPWNLDALEKLEEEYGKNIYNVLQLRVHPELIKIKENLEKNKSKSKHKIELTYITSRGPWYDFSWKGEANKSGGICTNIGIHFFDLLIWLFGNVQNIQVHLMEDRRAGGFIELENGIVTWFLSINKSDLPNEITEKGQRTYRSIRVDDGYLEFSGGFTDLHTKIYQLAIDGKGFKIKDARPSIELVHKIRNQKIESDKELFHPMVKKILSTP